MIAFHPNSACERAEQYYYEFLADDMRKLVPEVVIDHLGQCEHCQERMRQLEQVLSRSESDIESRAKIVDRALATMLRLHFAYIGKQVTCNTVKPFLPTLLDHALEVRIPTPITAHIDNCSQCTEDLEAIRSLNLDRKQLRRLSELFAEAAPPSSSPCLEDGNAVRSVAAMDFNSVSSETLSHVCKCPVCRGLLHDERSQMLEKLTSHAGLSKFPCESVLNADVFDYVVPYGLDPATDQYGKFRRPFVSHVATCRDCLSKVQQLHDLLYGIVDRPDSGVVTVYNMGDAEKPLPAPQAQEFYSGFPIAVEVRQPEDGTDAQGPSLSLDLGAAPARRFSLKNLRSLTKVGFAAAAVVLIGFALFFSTPAAKGITLEQIYRVIEKARNVYIAGFVPNRKEPVQEQWVSKVFNVQLTKTEGKYVLWDTKKAIKKTKHSDTGIVEAAYPSAEMISQVKETIGGFWGLVPFSDLSAIPPGSQWRLVVDHGSLTQVEGLEAYELTWSDRLFDGSTVAKKWRVFVEPGTALPQKTEFYEQLPSDTEFVLKSTKVVKYLSESEFKTVLQEMFP